jgi:hypothetical protein
MNPTTSLPKPSLADIVDQLGSAESRFENTVRAVRGLVDGFVAELYRVAGGDPDNKEFYDATSRFASLAELVHEDLEKVQREFLSGLSGICNTMALGMTAEEIRAEQIAPVEIAPAISDRSAIKAVLEESRRIASDASSVMFGARTVDEHSFRICQAHNSPAVEYLAWSSGHLKRQAEELNERLENHQQALSALLGNSPLPPRSAAAADPKLAA